MKKNKENRGMILVLASIVIICLLLFIAPFLIRLSAQFHSTERSYQALVALNLAEAGVEKAVWELNYGNISNWEGDNILRSLIVPEVRGSGGNVLGEIRIDVVNLEGNNPIVRSAGRTSLSGSQSVERSIIVILERRGAPLFNCGVFANEGVILNPGVVVDGNVGTNGTSTTPGQEAIILNNGSAIRGDASCGPGGDPLLAIKLNGSAIIEGERKALLERKEFPSVVEPEWLHYYPDGITISGSAFIDETYSRKYPFFHISGGSLAKVVGNVVLAVDDLIIDHEASLEIENSGSLTVFINNSINISNSCYINNTLQDATKLVFYGTDSLTGDIEFSCKTVFYGAIYMPRANISLARDFDFYGACYANIIQLNRNVHVTYDEGLGSLEGTPTALQGSHFSIKYWQQK